MSKVYKIDPTNPQKCDHVLVYTWQRQPDNTETETLKCLYCGAYVVDSEMMERLRDFAWNTPIETTWDDWNDNDD